MSPNFFDTLGVSPARGRAFLTGAAAPDDDRSAIVSDRLWRTSLKADPAIVGQSITIDGLPRTDRRRAAAGLQLQAGDPDSARCRKRTSFCPIAGPATPARTRFSSCWAA